MNVILSIKPRFCESIFEGVKRYEYRKAIFRRSDIDKVYVYASKPICKVIGYFTLDNILYDTPSKIWVFTHKYGGVSKQFFDEYFDGHGKAYAIGIRKAIRFTAPIDPKSIIDSFHAPQTFIYTDIELEEFQ